MIQCDMKEIPFLGLIGIVSHRAVNTARGMYREFDLNRRQASVLFMLHQQDSMSQKELAAKLNITAPSITSMIQKMERDQYITREPDRHDQRVMRLTLTEKGRSCIRAVEDVADRMEEIMLQGMSLEEKLLFRRFLIQAGENLMNHERKERG